MSMMDFFKKAADKADKKKKEKDTMGFGKTRGGQSTAGKEAADALEEEGKAYAAKDEE